MREALIEREVLLRGGARTSSGRCASCCRTSPEQRPAWLVRLGLFLYDHLGGRKRLPATRALDLRRDRRARRSARIPHAPSNIPTAGSTMRGWSCSTRSTRGQRGADDPDPHALRRRPARRRAVAGRAGGPPRRPAPTGRAPAAWSMPPAPGSRTSSAGVAGLNSAAGACAWSRAAISSCRSSGTGRQAYLLQNDDKRVIFVNPYEGDLGADRHHRHPGRGPPEDAAIDAGEIDYLLAA